MKRKKNEEKRLRLRKNAYTAGLRIRIRMSKLAFSGFWKIGRIHIRSEHPEPFFLTLESGFLLGGRIRIRKPELHTVHREKGPPNRSRSKIKFCSSRLNN